MGPLLHGLRAALHAHATAADAVDAGALPPLYLLSGHDTTVMPLAAALGIPLERWPPYCANIVRARRCAFLCHDRG
jgi:hypothetical protein